MTFKTFGYWAAGFSIAHALLLSEAHALWTITTYLSKIGGEITSTRIADQYLRGEKPTRFTGIGTVPEVDLFESGVSGQFMIDHAFPGVDVNEADGSTSDFATQVTGTLVVNTAGSYDFFTDTDDGNRLRIDLDQDGMFEDLLNPSESVVPDGGLQGVGTAERSRVFTLATGEYKFEFTTWERAGGAGGDAGYRVRQLGVPVSMAVQRVLGDSSGGIALKDGMAMVRTVGADLDAVPRGPLLNTLADADSLRTDPSLTEPGFPVSAVLDTFNIMDTAGDGAFTGGVAPPGLRAAGIIDGEDFAVYGTGTLVVPMAKNDVVFRLNTDDGARLLVDLTGDGDFDDAGDFSFIDDTLHGSVNMDTPPVNLPAGNFKIEAMFFERGGGASGEVSVNLGTGFRLLGQQAAVTAGTSLDVIGGVLPAVNGDFNNNGVVDAADYVLWRNGGPLMNDPTPGVQPEDYNTWRTNFGRTPGAGAAAASSVPEATTLLSAYVAVLVGFVTTRSRRS